MEKELKAIDLRAARELASSPASVSDFSPFAQPFLLLDAGSGGMIKALMPGRVTRILVQEGESVRKGAGLLILEAMKMENEIQAPADGTIDRILVTPGQTVEGGAELLHLA